MDATALRRLAAKKGMSQKALAGAMGVHPRTLYNKLAGKSQFKEREIRAVTRALGLNRRQVDQIFFGTEVN